MISIFGQLQTIMRSFLTKSILLIAALLSSTSLLAQEKAERTIDDAINDFMEPITGAMMEVIFFTIPIGSMDIPFVLVWLIVGALFFTVYMGFINIRGFKHAIQVVSGKYDNPDDAGEVSHFQALTAALSGTVGVGNIAGVAIAISLGGPGATFWMISAGLIGMSSKFVECTLGLKYRKEMPDGSVSGGPMYYLSQGLAKQGKAGLGKILAAIFAIACIGGSFGGGNMVQINQATQQLIDVTGGEASMFFERGWIFGVIMAVIVGAIIIGGIKSIARVTDKVVPFMVGIYVLAALIVIGVNIHNIGWAFEQIFVGAFSPEAMYGGKTDEPVSEGIVALLEPFIDTVVICTMTALVIIFADYGQYTHVEAFDAASTGGNAAGIGLTSSAFAETISWFPVVLSVAVILFALSTMISWSYYGIKAWTYLFGDSKASITTYKVIFCMLIVVGAAISANQVFDFGDAMIFAMCFPNVLGLYFLSKEVKIDLKSYFARIKSGEIKAYK